MHQRAVTITKRGIDLARVSGECPVTTAIKQVVPGVKKQAKLHGIEINSRFVTFPEHVRDWITAFDCGESVSPLTFVIRL